MIHGGIFPVAFLGWKSSNSWRLNGQEVEESAHGYLQVIPNPGQRLALLYLCSHTWDYLQLHKHTVSENLLVDRVYYLEWTVPSTYLGWRIVWVLRFRLNILDRFINWHSTLSNTWQGFTATYPSKQRPTARNKRKYIKESCNLVSIDSGYMSVHWLLCKAWKSVHCFELNLSESPSSCCCDDTCWVVTISTKKY